ncbi:MAG: hypothetical protein A3C70_02685 [Candidatus Zambryskibacteria bacterium RIFCSPHIGHO2_02_FULL_43_14]|uniref:Outer membrane protein beta-barrel domain-containing protein n=1 Tax=Candidatus Zambryskibacteria bacterium RIFCSPHIGHO2_02_FULL_43_14 TaxID=1802748 RepID=A0A1G2THL1_9BACT|nr:MAG: hypothetical protein A3C70_02685 [Candidatus Zambryskibacteria bacterium RIFCSPHIGHO2_02_FULL_43_14]
MSAQAGRGGSVKRIILVLTVLLVPSLVQAQDAEIGVYYQNLSGNGEQASHRIFSEGYVYLNDKSGVWGFAYGEKEYFSAVAGLFHDLFSFGNDAVFEIGVGAGAERFLDEDGANRLYPRLAGTVFIRNQSLFSDVYYENGTSGEDWLRVNALWQATGHIALGVIHQTGDGIGPKASLSIPKVPVRVWVAPMFGKERKFLAGGELLFQKGGH